MCLAYPGQVVSIDAVGALIETDGRQQRASLLLMPEVVVGDWVVVAAGAVINRLEPEEADEIRALLDRGQEPDDALMRVGSTIGRAALDA